MTDSSTPAGFVRQGWRWSGRLLTGVISLALTLLGLLAFTFTLSHLAPIDPTLQVAGDHASEATYAQVRRDLGLDQSVPVQFTRYLERLAHGDMGISRITAQPVASDLMRTFPATVELATCAILLGGTLGILLALLAVWKPGSWLDNVARMVGLRVPAVFVLFPPKYQHSCNVHKIITLFSFCDRSQP